MLMTGFCLGQWALYWGNVTGTNAIPFHYLHVKERHIMLQALKLIVNLRRGFVSTFSCMTAVIALMVLLTYHLDGHIWCKALEKMLVVP